MDNSKTVCIIVYGCAKNQVDAEEMASRLKEAGYRLSADPGQSDAIVVHTCGFIEDAKKESIEGILRACSLAQEAGSGAGRKVPVLVTGCLSQRYPDELLHEVPELSGVAGTGAPRDIVSIVGAALAGERVRSIGAPGRGAPGESVHRTLISPGDSWTYLRVSEGCRHHCTYCAIPSMRGTLVSRTPEDILEEARSLVAGGITELNLIAQDLSDYGHDLFGERRLAALVTRLASIPGAWIRLLYLRPDGVTPELADAMTQPGVVPYVDLPVEHGSAKVLRLMGRPGPDLIMRAVETLRSRMPGIFIRTTVIAGFPGEIEKDVEETKSLLEAMGAHRVGVFPYSREEGTPAFGLPGAVPEDVAKDRAEDIRKFGIGLARKSSQSMVGKRMPVLILRPSERPGYWLGRGPHQAPEVDGRVYVRAEGPARGIVDTLVTRAAVLNLFARGAVPGN